jgi:hypothetical protein
MAQLGWIPAPRLPEPERIDRARGVTGDLASTRGDSSVRPTPVRSVLKLVLGTTTDAKGVVTDVAIRCGAFCPDPRRHELAATRPGVS